MEPIWIVRHVAHEGPGYLAEFLLARHFPYRLVKVDAGDALPNDVHGMSALVSMGGPMSANDDLPWIPREIDLIRRAVNADLPVLGHCLGAQLIAKALGGEVRANDGKEIGWYDVSRLPNHTAQDWLGALPTRFEAFHWHGETFSIPDGTTAILSSKLCGNQAFATDKVLGLQCHIEMTPGLVRDWVTRNAQELKDNGAGVQGPDEMTRELEARTRRLARVADVIYARWLGPMLSQS